MSWSFRKVGTIREALKASVQAESAPQAVKDEICARIDGIHIFSSAKQSAPQASQSNELPKGQAIYVASHGHLDADTWHPYRGFDEMTIRVINIPLIDTPLG